MSKIELFKKYADGEVKSVSVIEKKEAISFMLSKGFYLTQEEAISGQVKPEPEPAPAPAEPEQKPEPVTPKKPPVKRKTAVKKPIKVAKLKAPKGV